MSNHDLGTLPKIQWLSALDASDLPARPSAAPMQGIAVPGALALRQRPATMQFAGQLGGIGTEPFTTGHAVPRPRVESVSFPVPANGYVSATKLLGRAATNHNSTVIITGKQYATSINVRNGVGTSGPPRGQEPA